MKLPFAGRLLAVAILAGATATLPVSSAFAQTPEKPKVALVMKSLANEFFLTMEDGAKAYQKDHSGDFELISNGIKDETDTAGSSWLSMLITVMPASTAFLMTGTMALESAGAMTNALTLDKIICSTMRVWPAVSVSSLMPLEISSKSPEWSFW